MENKVLVIGIDGATWDLLDPWIEKNELPVLGRLKKRGCYGTLNSCEPSFTIPAWNVIFSGKNPAKIGAFYMLSKVPGEYKFEPYFLQKYEKHALWDDLKNKKIILANIPSIHEPYKINGEMVLGWLYKDKDKITYPENLKTELDRLVSGYEIDVLQVRGMRENNEGWNILPESKLVQIADRVLAKQTKVFKYLLKKEWDFSAILFSTPDRLQHRIFNKKFGDKDNQILLAHYKLIDEAIGEIICQSSGDIDFFIISDHGFGARNHTFNLNQWLLKERYLVINKKKSFGFLRFINFLRSHKLTKPFVGFLYLFVPRKVKSFIVDKTMTLKLDGAEINWQKTSAFSLGKAGEIFINLKNREDKGIVSKEDYDKLRNEIIHKLRSIENPDGKGKLINKVFKREEIYDGPYASAFPDLLIDLDDDVQAFDEKLGHKDIVSPSVGGDHRKNGIFLAFGPNIKQDFQIKDASILDITPTILSIFDLPIDKDIDGKIIDKIFINSHNNKKEISKQQVSQKAKICQTIKKLKKAHKI